MSRPSVGGATTPPVPVGVLVQDGITMLDVAGPADVFAHAGGYRTTLISIDGRDVTASNGLRLPAETTVDAVGPLDTLLVPGAYGMLDRPLPAEIVEAVRTLAPRARRIASVCTGSFLLAAAGLLDGRRATTHWTRTDRFRRAFPAVSVVDDLLFVRDGPVLTSAGIGSGTDLALTLVEDDRGPQVAREVARQMVLFQQRPGGASQLSVRHRAPVAPDRPLRSVVDAVVADPAGRHTVTDMAARAHVSARQLARLFHDELDTTPARYVEDVRLEAAQMLLQEGRAVAATAELSGFGSAETLRRVFVGRLGVSPSVYQETVR